MSAGKLSPMLTFAEAKCIDLELGTEVVCKLQLYLEETRAHFSRIYPAVDFEVVRIEALAHKV